MNHDLPLAIAVRYC